MYRMAICEDEFCQLEALCFMCSEILKQMDIAHEIAAFASADELDAAIKSGAQFNLLCLDILMTGQNGMELASKLRKRDEQTSIIFITCTKDYLLDGYSVRPIQYLLKPVNREELEKAIQTDIRLNHQMRTICLKAKGTTSVLPLADIRYVESRNHGSLFFISGDERFFQINLTEVESLLPSAHFGRCHNSFLVNLSQIRAVNSREVLLMDGTTLPIGRRYGRDFQGSFIRYLNRNER